MPTVRRWTWRPLIRRGARSLPPVANEGTDLDRETTKEIVEWFEQGRVARSRVLRSTQSGHRKVRKKWREQLCDLAQHRPVSKFGPFGAGFVVSLRLRTRAQASRTHMREIWRTRKQKTTSTDVSKFGPFGAGIFVFFRLRTVGRALKTGLGADAHANNMRSSAAAAAGDIAAAAVNAATILCETLTLTRAVREHLTLEAVGVGSGWEHPRHHRVLGRF